MAVKKRAASDARPDFSLEARERAFIESETIRDRVFGQRPLDDDDEDDTPFEDPMTLQGKTERANVSTAKSTLNKDLQVLTLLNSLGERLVRSEKERAAIQQSLKDYQRIIKQLEVRSDKSEQNFNALILRQKQIEELQRKQLERLEKTAAFADKIEEALAQQARLHRRLDKITQDKAGFIRKLESIEESVIETQAAIRLYAVPALRPETAAPTAAPRAEKSADRKTWWRSSVSRQYAGIAAGVVVAFLLGFIVMRPPVVEPAISYDTATLDQPPAINNTGDEIRIGEAPAPDFAPPPQEMIEPVDVMNATDADLAQRFDANEEELAAALNDIEPGVSEEQVPEEIVAQTPVMEEPAAPAEIAAIEPAAAPETPAVMETAPAAPAAPVATAKAASGDAAQISAAPAAAFLETQKLSGSIESRIERDKKLPAMIRDVEKQAYAGSAEAQHDLAAIYTAGHGGVEVDYTRAALWFREAALGGIANARYNLGVLYHQGMGVEKSLPNAIGWYHAAAALNHPEAEYNLGIAHIEGIGTPYDANKAAAYFRDAARQGVMEAAYNLGLIYENGLLGAPQPEEAIFWYKNAANAGSPEAAAAMNQLTRAMKMDDATVERIINERSVKEKAAVNALSSAAASSAPAPLTPADAAPTIAETTPAPSQRDYAMIAQVQEQLIRRGLLPANIDTADMSKTEDAVRLYQRQNGLTQDGRVTNALLLHMLSAEAPAAGGDTSAGALRPNDMALPDFETEFGSRE